MDEKNSHNARAMREQSMTVDIAEDEIDIRQYLNLLVQEWWLIVLCAVLAVSAAGSYAFFEYAYLSSRCYATGGR